MIATILSNLRNTVIAGFVLAFLVFLLYLTQTEFNNYVFWPFLIRWFHIISGIMWIGILWYFNFVQTPTMPKIPAELKPGVSKHIAPSALFFFRWGAAFTVLTGLIIAWRAQYLVEALTLKPGFHLIGIGMWLALVMAFNVWFVIWPNQKKALGLVPAEDAVKAKAATTAMMFSRTNSILSIPMLYCMINLNGG